MQRDFLGLMAKKMFQDRSSPVPNPGCDMGGTAVGLLIYLLRGHLFHACRIELPHWTGLGDPDARLEGDYMLDWVEKVAREDITDTMLNAEGPNTVTAMYPGSVLKASILTFADNFNPFAYLDNGELAFEWQGGDVAYYLT
ncbi:hypothetical protein EYZ11_003139 [Aspergillus tanneri]|uniref:Uncharacterized protein n=1 Tax=Aspergillus tanneri TaxID=1220188 RepID=A0A4S3JNZ5_9EURO|nr:hypothetical protein EYZ11_003139 [Aspergillus tanneri]